MNKKKSKCCCIYEKSRSFDESSSEDSDDDECEHCHGHKDAHKKIPQHNPDKPMKTSRLTFAESMLYRRKV
ncbi:E3 ubiquitin-protein ligase PPP1R11-like [Ceratina calcarata]|nr:E3 ubiquitin-protein ligase PPP1R11-like [Ceratina calcarata]XP_026672097.1 E3 ubiquitin-protein ligase PPP1R11-like [Ceratina calcarata]XP_026672098.1 E3 ubiquitin-protein ligase PPP1R11-like [Ceratina calcarata]